VKEVCMLGLRDAVGTLLMLGRLEGTLLGWLLGRLLRFILGMLLRDGTLLGWSGQNPQDTAQAQKFTALVAPLEIQYPSRHWLNFAAA
jgi:hypothetical protein